MSLFEATLCCTNCSTEWPDSLDNPFGYSTAEMMELILALWQGAGCPDCGWTEVELKWEFGCGMCHFDGIRGEEEEDEEVTLKRSDLEYLLERAGIDFDEDDGEESEFEY